MTNTFFEGYFFIDPTPHKVFHCCSCRQFVQNQSAFIFEFGYMPKVSLQFRFQSWHLRVLKPILCRVLYSILMFSKPMIKYFFNVLAFVFLLLFHQGKNHFICKIKKSNRGMPHSCFVLLEKQTIYSVSSSVDSSVASSPSACSSSGRASLIEAREVFTWHTTVLSG